MHGETVKITRMSVLLHHYTKAYCVGTARRFRGDLLSIVS